MSEFDPLNYRPDFERDKKVKTGWEQEEFDYTSIEETEKGFIDVDLQITNIVGDYLDFKEEFKQEVEDLEESLEDLSLEDSEYVKKALEETGHTSIFSPSSFRELFEKKESSAGEYLLGVLEKEIESEHGDIKWEAFIEYLEMEEEIDVLDYYISEIIYPLIGYKPNSNDTIEDIKELEEIWAEKTIDLLAEHKVGEYTYQLAMITDPDLIPRARDELHNLEEHEIKSRQEISQVNSGLMVVEQKELAMRRNLNNIRRIIATEIEEEILIDELQELTMSKEHKEHVLKDSLIHLKQSIDNDNNKKRELKHTRRNIYSKDKQKRIINEYSTVNHLYRENSLPSAHYMKSFQDNAGKQLNVIFNQTAKSIEENFKENKEKTYETFLLQISTSQTRDNRLSYVRSKQESRLIFNNLMESYK